MSNHAAMNKAQQRYDDMAPPEDDETEVETCASCDGTGESWMSRPNRYRSCLACDGKGVKQLTGE